MELDDIAGGIGRLESVVEKIRQHLEDVGTVASGKAVKTQSETAIQDSTVNKTA